MTWMGISWIYDRQSTLQNKEGNHNRCYPMIANTIIKQWISIETLDKIKEKKNKKTAINNSRTRAEKVQAQAEYTEANKQVKKEH
ncbi:unnamed protein product [Schistosoma curassoni]|uniref:Transposase n=1 Tax=Schistosoma curassoni TaxID=6186 RepID=A0A183JI09_9TREM|nr:unnamed protein product [Schistosoma curassoni]